MTEPPVTLRSSTWKRLLGSPWLKGAIAVAVVALLVGFNRLDWRALMGLRDTWPSLVLAFALMLPPFLIVSWRFCLILRSQGIDVGLRTAWRWTMIGAFFDLAMPSSNGGDVVKAGYVVKHVGAGMRTRAVMAVAIDRVLGLVGLFMLASATMLLGWNLVRHMPGIRLLFAASLAASAGALIFFRLLGARRLIRHARFQRMLGDSPWGVRLRLVIGAFNDLREQPAVFASALGVSMLNHIFWCASLLCISDAMGYDVPIINGFTVFPIAIFANVFGVAGGFGIGTAAFDLFVSHLLGIPNGALIGLLFQTMSAVSRLLGLPFYLVSQQRNARSRHAFPGSFRA